MFFALHAASSETVGWGHFFRLCALGEGLLSKGHDVFFAVSDPQASLSVLAAQLGFKVGVPGDLQTKTSKYIVVVDDYEPDDAYFSGLRDRGCSIVQIVDSGSWRRLRDATIIRPDPLVPDDGEISGIGYCMISRDVRRVSWTESHGNCPDVAVVIGGSGDQLDQEVIRLLEGVRPVKFSRIRSLMPANLVDRSVFLENLSRSTFAITGSGTMLWECCTMGVPALALSVAENQREQARWAAANGLCLTAELSNSADLRAAFGELCDNLNLRNQISARGPQLIDGKGVDRVIEFLETRFGNG